jgi:NAD(P)-dependent dehydrogenase (short-subunit alcohol dehydrogenase family)
MSTQDRSVFITGVSSGIGHALAEHALELGYWVYGTARRRPDQLLRNDKFKFASIDLFRLELIEMELRQFLADCPRQLDFVFLNAGSFGSRPSRGEDRSIEEFQSIFALNLHANKIIIDHFIRNRILVHTYVVSSSISAVRQREGMLAYSSSKAALNAMISVYALENKDTFFALLGLCNVDTQLGRTIVDVDASLPELFELAKRVQQSGYTVSPEQRAADIFQIALDPENFGLRSGVFAEIRSLLQLKQIA